MVLAAVLCACGARVGGDAAVDARPLDAPECSNGRVVFLSFEGETLTDGAVSDARSNVASWMTIASGAAPRYRTGAADREQQIHAIVDGVRAQLASFPIAVVTARPSAGDYVMVVYGGQASQVGSPFGAAVQQLDCDDATTRNDVAWVADAIEPTQAVVNVSIGAIGFGLGLTATTTTTDCMCGWDNACDSDNSLPCTLSSEIARDPTANQLCPGNSQDEVAVFRAGFCQ